MECTDELFVRFSSPKRHLGLKRLGGFPDFFLILQVLSLAKVIYALGVIHCKNMDRRLLFLPLYGEADSLHSICIIR